MCWAIGEAQILSEAYFYVLIFLPFELREVIVCGAQYEA